MANKKLNKINIILLIMLLIFAGIFIFSAYKVISYYSASNESEEEFQELKKYIEVIPEEEATRETGGENQTSENENVPKRQKYDYNALKKQNGDFFGWIYIEDTKIDYPVMHTPLDPEYYLSRSFKKRKSSRGTLFIDGKCFENCGNYIIYGHNMLDKTMFGMLSQYRKKDFFENHKYIYFDTLDDSGVYEVFAVFTVRTSTEFENTFRYYEGYDLTNESDYNEYVKAAKKNSSVKTDVTPTFGDGLLTLSTCYGKHEDGRLCVVAKKLK